MSADSRAARTARSLPLTLLALVLLGPALLAGCGGSSSPGVPAAVAPAVTGNPANATVAVGATASFSVTASGTAPLSYQWRRGGTAIAGATAASYTTPATVAGDNGASFDVVVTNTAGSATSAAATLTVTVPVVATITTQPSDLTIAAGGSAAFTVAATCSDSATASLQWQRSNDAGASYTDVAGATSGTYTLTVATGDDGARLRARASCGAVTATSNAALLTVTPVTAAAVGPCFGATANSGWCWQAPSPSGRSYQSITTADANTAWAIGDLGVVVKTTDGGTTWRRVRRFDTEGGFFTSISAVSTSVVWAAGQAGRIMRSTDGGTTWNFQTSGTTDLLFRIDAVDANVAWTVGPNGVLRTIDAGTTWTLRSPPPFLQAIEAIDANTAFAVGVDSAGRYVVYRTTDGGANWSPSAPLTMAGNVEGFAMPTATAGWLLTASGAIARTTDGVNWTIGSVQTVGAQVTALAATSATNAWVALSDGSVTRTTDGGTNWTPGTAKNFTQVEAMSAQSATLLYAAGANGLLRKSSDGGASWVDQSKGPWLQLLTLSGVDANTAWAAGFGGTVARTVDGGATWTLVRDDSAPLRFTGDLIYSVAAISASTAYIVDGSRFLKTTDGGATWTASAALGGGAAQISKVSASVLWAAGGGGFVARSVDGGVTWTPTAIPAARNAFRIRALDAQVAVLLMDDGSLRQTADGGATWATAVTGFASQLRDAIPLDAQTILAVGLNGIMRRSTDRGATFTTVATPTTDDINSIQRAPGAPNTLYAGGFFDMLKSTDGGLTWRSQKATLPYWEVAFVNDLAVIDANVVWGTAVGTPGLFKTTTGGD